MASIRHPSLTFARTFSSTPSAQALSAVRALARKHENIAPYPYQRSLWFNQSNFGLYGNTRIRFGNSVSEITETKTRRKWHPNIKSKRLWSHALDRYIRMKVSVRALRTIDKAGGLDEYLLGEKSGRIKEMGMAGWALRWRVLRSPKGRERMVAERERLGLTGAAPWEDGWVGTSGEAIEEDIALQREKGIDAVLDSDVEVELESFEDEVDTKGKVMV